MSDEKGEVLGRLAVERGLVTREQLDETLAAQEAGAEAMGVTVPLAQIMVSKGLLTKDQAQELLNAVAVETGEARLVAGYEVISKLGQGGMGAVYKAKQTETGRLVALKILPPSLANPGLVARFKREAEITAKLDHANIVRCVEFGFDKRRKCHFCALELVEGEDLAKRIAREGTLAEAEAVGVTRQVADALQHAFQNGLIHRDVKPENIMVTPDGTAKLLDLGLARAASAEATRLTQTGMFVGSAYYASPEQALGEKDLDTRSDIYSLGCTLYHMLTGKPPFGGTTVMQILQKHVNEKLPWPADLNPDISQGLCRVIARMMAKSPGDRYQTPLHVLADLDLLKGGGEPEVSEEVLAKSSIAPALGGGDGDLRIAPASSAAGPALPPFIARAPEPRPARAPRRTRDRAAREPLPEGAPAGGLPMGVKIGIGAGVAVVLVVGLVMMLGGKEKDEPKPEKPSDKPAAAAADVPAGPSKDVPGEASGSATKASAEAALQPAGEPASPAEATAPEPEAPEPVADPREAAALDVPAPERIAEPVAPVEPTGPGMDTVEPVRPAGPRPASVPADAVEFGGRWYKLFPKPMPWHDAKRYCEEAGGHLVTITSKEEHEFLVSLSRDMDLHAWLGLTDERVEGKWEWVTGEASGFAAWHQGEPNNNAGREHYAMLRRKDRAWTDVAKEGTWDGLGNPACEWEPAGGVAVAGAGTAPVGSADVDLTRGLVGWWKFDEAGGAVALDSSGKGNHGTLVGNARWTGRRGGRISGACRLGADGHIATSIPGPHRTDLTWSAWIRTATARGGILANTNGAWVGGGKSFSLNGGRLAVDAHSYHSVVTELTVNDGAWRHVALTVEYSGRARDTFKVYADGVEQHVTRNWDFFRVDGTSLKMRIGDCPGESGGFVGDIDDVRIYDRALSAEEVALLADPGRLAAPEGAPATKSEIDEKLSALLAEFDALIGKDDYVGARAFASREARAKDNPPHAETLRAASRVATALGKRRDAMVEAAGRLVGNQAEFVTARGKLAGEVGRVTDEGIVLEIKKKMRGMGTIETKITVKWAELDPKEEERLAKGWKPEGPDGHVARAYVALARRDERGALAALDAAGDLPLAAHLRGEMGTLRHKQAARAEWSAIQAKAQVKEPSPAQTKALLELIEAFEGRHRGSKFAASVAEELAELKSRTQALWSPGLLGTYFSDRAFRTPVLRRIDPQVAFVWGGSPGRGVPQDQFSIRWEGLIIPPETGNYIFYLTSDDRSRLWIAGKLVISAGHEFDRPSKPLGLQAGKAYPLQLEHEDDNSDARMTLLWTGPGILAPVPVPPEALSPPKGYEQLADPPVQMPAGAPDAGAAPAGATPVARPRVGPAVKGGRAPDIKTVQRLLRGKVLRWDPETLEIDLIYGFDSPAEMADFEPQKGEWRIEKGVLRSAPGPNDRTIRHRAVFSQTCMVRCSTTRLAGDEFKLSLNDADRTRALILMASTHRSDATLSLWAPGRGMGTRLWSRGAAFPANVRHAMQLSLSRGSVEAAISNLRSPRQSAPGFDRVSVGIDIWGVNTDCVHDDLRMTGGLDREWLERALGRP